MGLGREGKGRPDWCLHTGALTDFTGVKPFPGVSPLTLGSLVGRRDLAAWMPAPHTVDYKCP